MINGPMNVKLVGEYLKLLRGSFFDSFCFIVHNNCYHSSLSKFAEETSLNYTIIIKSSILFVEFVATVV